MSGAGSVPKTMAMPLVLAVVAFVLAVASVIVLGYLWVALGDRGLYADATGTAGYTTPLEGAALVGGLLGVIVFPSLFAVFLVIAIRRRSRLPKLGD
jgi:hypothetical protein